MGIFNQIFSDVVAVTLDEQPAAIVTESNSLREAADKMVEGNIGRLIVVSATEPTIVKGILTRSDILAAHASRLRETQPDLTRTVLES